MKDLDKSLDCIYWAKLFILSMTSLGEVGLKMSVNVRD